jgi:hypothetical protein
LVLKIQQHQQKNLNQGILITLQEQYSVSDRRRQEKDEEFLRMREDAGRTAVMSRTNKPLRPTDLNTKETAVSGKIYGLEMTRIDFIRTRNKHK